MAGSFVRISSLLWADILVAFALFVMQNYLSDVWKLSFTHAAGILNAWNGISMILPLVFLFFVDAFLGNFAMLLISSLTYTLGIGFIAMSTPPVLSDSIGHTERVLFYVGMALVGVGISGNLISVVPFLEEQKYDMKLKSIMQLPGFILVVIIPIVGAIALPYIRPWSLRFGIPAICTAFATLLFWSGCCSYDKWRPQGSPLTNVCRVFVAFGFNMCKPYPLDANDLHKRDAGEEDHTFRRTRFLRCLEKAAIVTNPEAPEANRWRLCSVAEVEEAKIAVRMVPMWMTFIICGIVSSIGNTYFLEQANHMNRKIGKWNVPLQILLLLSKWAKYIFSNTASKYLSTPNVYAPAKGIAIGMVFSILCCITAARIETRRLNVIRSNGLLDKPDEDIPMRIYWLLFQFFLLAGLDAWFEKSVARFYEFQAPKSMRNYLEYFAKAVTGLGFMCSVLSVHVVGKISEMGGRQNWFQFTLNRSRLDRYYWVLAGLSSANLLVYILVAICYSYRNLDANDIIEDEREESGCCNDIVQGVCSCF